MHVFLTTDRLAIGDTSSKHQVEDHRRRAETSYVPTLFIGSIFISANTAHLDMEHLYVVIPKPGTPVETL